MTSKRRNYGKWEYYTFTAALEVKVKGGFFSFDVGTTNPESIVALSEKLHNLGEQGWELATLTPLRLEGSSLEKNVTKILVVLKWKIA